MSNLHPLLVHFPIALLSASFFFDAAGVILRKAELQRTGWWMMLSGIGGMIIAITTGLLAEGQVLVPVTAQGVLDDHKQYAFLAALLFAILFLWRLAGRCSLPARMKWLFWALYAGGVFLIWIVAWHGGLLVYLHGVAVSVP